MQQQTMQDEVQNQQPKFNEVNRLSQEHQDGQIHQTQTTQANSYPSEQNTQPSVVNSTNSTGRICKLPRFNFTIYGLPLLAVNNILIVFLSLSRRRTNQQRSQESWQADHANHDHEPKELQVWHEFHTDRRKLNSQATVDPVKYLICLLHDGGY